MSSETLKDEIKKAHDIALANGLDLIQIHKDQNSDSFIKHGVKVGVACWFICDIGNWVNENMSC